MKRFLLFRYKTVCYQSYYAFIDCMAAALQSLGHIVDICDQNTTCDLSVYSKHSYDAILDINSTLPSRKTVNGVHLLDQLDGPFFNFLLDHPLYYHEQLLAPVKNHHVLCLDRRHVAYINDYYPNICSAHFLPLGMMPAQRKDLTTLDKRPISLLFTGTYTPLSRCREKIEQCHPDIQKEVYTLASMMRTHTSFTIEDAMRNYIDELGVTVTPAQFAGFTYSHFLADTYVAAQIRDEVICTLLAAKIPITVCGHSWDQLYCPGISHLTILPECTYLKAVSLAGDAKILLNIMPWFKAGLHDRVLTAMSHRTVSCTDTTSFIEEVFTPQTQLLTYSLDDLSKLNDLLLQALADEASLQEIADCGHSYAQSHFTWVHQMQKFISIIDERTS